MRKHLVFIGDSLTEWFDWQQRFPDYQAANLGVSGETVQGLLARRGRIRSQIAEPDFIFLMTGINNIANEQYDIARPYREIVRNLTTWYKRSMMIVQSILPVDLTWIDSNIIRNTNRELEQIAQGYEAEYLDVYAGFVDNEGNPKTGYLQDDGVHLSSKGYEVWANEVERFLRKRS